MKDLAPSFPNEGDMHLDSLAKLSDRDLLAGLRQLMADHHQVEADLLTHLAEVEVRELYLDEGCSSMFVYCTEMLHLSESSAYNRIQASRTARRFPVILQRIRAGELHLAALRLLGPHLTPDNHVELLDQARHMSKRALEHLLVDRAPRPAAPASIRRVPRRSIASQVSPQTRDDPERQMHGHRPRPDHSAEPLGEERYKVQFTASRALRDKLQTAQALLRHQIPDGDLAKVFERALTLLVDDAKRKKFAQTSRPTAPPAGDTDTDVDADTDSASTEGTPSRHIPAAIKRAVAERDGECCAFVSKNGRRCKSRDFLEYHHKESWAKAKRHSIDGIELRCRAHNHHAAVEDYGAEYMRRYRTSP